MIYTGLPHGQEKSENQKKSGKTKKNDKGQEKKKILSVQIYQIPYILKPSICKKLIKNSLESD